ncbi:hypothetical protein T484DRAFT_1628965, partial [Baffinella frigidus]
NPKPQTPNPKPQTLNPKPQTLNPKPQTLNPKPQTLNPKPQTLNPKPQTPNPKPSPRSTAWRKHASGTPPQGSTWALMLWPRGGRWSSRSFLHPTRFSEVDEFVPRTRRMST